MNKISITAASVVTEADLKSARLGQRFGRLDLSSQLALLAVAELNINFAEFANGRVGIVFAASAGSLSTDVNFWNGRHGVGGPSPTLFAYTLPSAAVGEIAIHFKLTGPDLCFVGDGKNLLREAADLIRRGETDACVCIFCEAVTADCEKIISTAPAAAAHAVWVRRGEGIVELREFDRDFKALCALISQSKSAV
jgi:3-oxoacyl-(acyl-carrier-protein) synthase